MVYLGPYQYGFRRLMLSLHWIRAIRERGLTIVFDQISTVKGRIIQWKLNSLGSEEMNNEEEQLLTGNEYRQMLFALIEFLLGEQIYLKWLTEGILPSEMENFTLIELSKEYPPLIIDPSGQIDRWIHQAYQAQIIYFDDKSLPLSSPTDLSLLSLSLDPIMRSSCPLNKRFSRARHCI